MDRQNISPSTRRTETKSQKALQHYVESQQRELPALVYEVCCYLARCYACGDVAQLGFRLAVIGRWHLAHDFPDPTACPSVVALTHQIRHKIRHPKVALLQVPPTITDVEYLTDALLGRFHDKMGAVTQPTPRSELVACRNRAILLISFWFGLTTAEVCRLWRSDVKLASNSVTITTDRIDENGGRARFSFQLESLTFLCPLAAIQDWLVYSNNSSEYLFPRATRRSLPGPIGSRSVQANFKELMAKKLGLECSTRSFRYSLYFFLADNGWSRQKILKTLPFYKATSSKCRVGKTKRNSPVHTTPPKNPAKEMMDISAALVRSRYSAA